MKVEEYQKQLDELNEEEREFIREMSKRKNELRKRYLEEHKPFNEGTEIEVDGKRGVVTSFRTPDSICIMMAGYWKLRLKNGKLSDYERRLSNNELMRAKIIERK